MSRQSIKPAASRGAFCKAQPWMTDCLCSPSELSLIYYRVLGFQMKILEPSSGVNTYFFPRKSAAGCVHSEIFKRKKFTGNRTYWEEIQFRNCQSSTWQFYVGTRPSVMHITNFVPWKILFLQMVQWGYFSVSPAVVRRDVETNQQGYCSNPISLDVHPLCLVSSCGEGLPNTGENGCFVSQISFLNISGGTTSRWLDFLVKTQLNSVKLWRFQSHPLWHQCDLHGKSRLCQ